MPDSSAPQALLWMIWEMSMLLIQQTWQFEKLGNQE
uniref:Uncharacterized protein n=1 Tax=Arundo donax TaxID=35708 RepID=A0A0A9E0N0_ARUDO